MFRHWSNSELKGTVENPGYYVGVYAILTALGLFIGTIQWLILYRGSIRASHVLYRRLLETVLFTNIRFHDTISRGRLLNRFGKDFEGIDSSLSDNFGRAFMSALSATITIITISVVGGLPFIAITAVLAVAYWNGKVSSSLFGSDTDGACPLVAKVEFISFSFRRASSQASQVYGQTSRDMRRLSEQYYSSLDLRTQMEAVLLQILLPCLLCTRYMVKPFLVLQ